MAFTHRRPCVTILPLALALLSLLASGRTLAATGPGDIAVFWGRNKAEGTLREACDTGTYTTVIISFLRGFGDHGAYTLDLSGHPLAGVGDDVKRCQSKGILVLLSIGGPAGGYSLPSTQSAADLAAYLWDAYLGGSRPGLRRPFGDDAALDGVDFYIDQSSSGGGGVGDHYDELARRLYAYNSRYRGRLGVTLTATVRCAYRDPRMAAALATGLFSRVHVRLYGGDARCTDSGRYAMEKWAAEYPGSRVFVGVSAEDKHGDTSTGDLKDLYYGILQFVEKLPNYGGLMIWNRYYDKMNHFISQS